MTTSVCGKITVLAPEIQWWTSMVPSISTLSPVVDEQAVGNRCLVQAAYLAEPSRVSCFMKCFSTRSPWETSASASGRQMTPSGSLDSEWTSVSLTKTNFAAVVSRPVERAIEHVGVRGTPALAEKPEKSSCLKLAKRQASSPRFGAGVAS